MIVLGCVSLIGTIGSYYEGKRGDTMDRKMECSLRGGYYLTGYLRGTLEGNVPYDDLHKFTLDELIGIVCPEDREGSPKPE